jgi:hypothetical protein
MRRFAIIAVLWTVAAVVYLPVRLWKWCDYIYCRQFKKDREYEFCHRAPLLDNPHKYFAALNQAISDPQISPLDKTIADECKRYADAGEAERVELRRYARPSCTLLLFAQRMAVRAMRERSVNDVRLGMLALSIEDQRDDFRDTVGSLAFLLHATRRISADFPSLAANAANLSSPRTADLLRTFAADHHSKQLSSYCLKEVTNENGVMISSGHLPTDNGQPPQ